MTDKLSSLLGRWETWDQDSRATYEISRKGKKVAVRAFDKEDGEEYLVSKIRWDGKSLTFEILVRSTKYRTRNRLIPVSKSRLIQEITFWEPWRKIG